MPKTKKHAAAKRAAKIAKAHATELPKLVVKGTQQRRAPGQKPPTRGIARYPWAAALTIALIALSVYLLYINEVGPFAPPAPDPKSANSPCLAQSVLSKVTTTASAPDAEENKKINRTYSEAPKLTIDTGKTYCAGINTNRGLIVVELKPQWAAQTVNNFVYLAQNKFYDGLTFHRVVPNLHIIQSGDPQGDGTGGPGYKFADEPIKGKYLAGTVAMANSGVNTNGSQFFINLADNSKQFQPQYNLFGQVVKGLDVALLIQGPDASDAARKNVKPDVMNRVIVVPAL
jgi:cyclophilin family peptidyl-prolyl cis-trans isomerase